VIFTTLTKAYLTKIAAVKRPVTLLVTGLFCYADLPAILISMYKLAVELNIGFIKQ